MGAGSCPGAALAAVPACCPDCCLGTVGCPPETLVTLPISWAGLEAVPSGAEAPETAAAGDWAGATKTLLAAGAVAGTCAVFCTDQL